MSRGTRNNSARERGGKLSALLGGAGILTSNKTSIKITNNPIMLIYVAAKLQGNTS